VRSALRCLILFAATIGLTIPVARAAPAGEILFVQGVGTVQSGGKDTRLLGKGVTIDERDVITTGPASYVLVKFVDGTRMTIRPESQLVVQTYRFGAATTGSAGSGAFVLDLLKGGLRTVTGLISKRDSQAAVIRTPTATVGIRGTDLDLRLCNGDCAREQIEALGHRKPRLNSLLASARVVQLQGTSESVGVDGARHTLLAGSPLYPGDTVETGANAFVVLGFRDQSKVTVQASTRARLEDFVFDERNPDEGRFLMNLVKGGLRAFTGLIGQANHEHVGIRTATATVGIRGTGIDVYLDDAGEFTGSTWLGVMAITQTSTGETLVVRADQAASFGAAGRLHFIPANPHTDGPRPDSVQVDWHQLFGHDAFDGTESGVWMYVRKGPVHVDGLNGQSLDAGDQEVLYFDLNGRAFGRPILIPLFFDVDDTPDPTQIFHFDLIDEVKASGVEAVCRQ
jgi:hypothetical protein